jgi:hypothetical protein
MKSICYLHEFGSNWEYYVSLFTVEGGGLISNRFHSNDNLHEFYKLYLFDSNRRGSAIKRKDLYVSSSESKYTNSDFIFLPKGDTVATLFRKHVLSLNEIERSNGYNIKPQGILSKYKNVGVDDLYGSCAMGIYISFNMHNRTMIRMPSIIDDWQEIGTVELEIIVDENGNVEDVYHRRNPYEAPTPPNLVKKAMQASREAKFSESLSGGKQHGTVTFVFM